MSQLWKPKADFRKFNPQSLEDIDDSRNFLEQFLPYERLYEHLTQKQLRELLQDAKRLHWEALDLRVVGLDTLPDMLGELEDLRVLSMPYANTLDGIFFCKTPGFHWRSDKSAIAEFGKKPYQDFARFYREPEKPASIDFAQEQHQRLARFYRASY